MIERDWLLRLDLYGDEKANEPNIDEINIACVISNTPVIHGFMASLQTEQQEKNIYEEKL